MHQSAPRQANSRASSNPWTSRKAGAGMSAGGRISLDDRMASSASSRSRKFRVWIGASFGVRYVPSSVRVKLTARCRQHDLVAQSRHRGVRRMVAVGRREADRACRKGWHHRLRGLHVEEEVPAGQLARLRRNFPAERQPVARGKAAVLARRIARIVRRDRILLLQARRVDKVLQEESVLFGRGIANPGSENRTLASFMPRSR